MITQDDIDNWFSYHAPSPDQIMSYEIIREQAKELAIAMLAACPPCADTTVAFRKLRETVMAANQAIACNSGG